MGSATALMDMGHHAVALLFVLANLATVARLVCYRRCGSRYRPGMAWVAYALVVCTGGQVLDVLTRQAVITPWQAGVAVVVALLVWRARGNVAAIVRVRP